VSLTYVSFFQKRGESVPKMWRICASICPELFILMGCETFYFARYFTSELKNIDKKHTVELVGYEQ
jgi:hypothetical protein